MRKANECLSLLFSVKCYQFLNEIFVLCVIIKLESLEGKCVKQETKQNKKTTKQNNQTKQKNPQTNTIKKTKQKKRRQKQKKKEPI